MVSDLGYEHLKRHGLRHTLTWMAYGGVPLHSLRKIAGHGTLATTQRYYTPTGSPSPTLERAETEIQPALIHRVSARRP